MQNQSNTWDSENGKINHNCQELHEQSKQKFRAGDLLGALEIVEKILSINSRDYEAWMVRGATLRDLGRDEEVLECYQHSININPNYYKTWYNQGLMLYYHLDQYEEALESFEQVIKLQPDLAEAWHNRGLALSELQRYEEALESFERATELQPDSVGAWNDRGCVLEHLQRYEEASESFKRATELQPDFTEAWHRLGLVLSKLQRDEEALEAFERAKKLEAALAEQMSSSLNFPVYIQETGTTISVPIDERILGSTKERLLEAGYDEQEIEAMTLEERISIFTDT